MKRLTALFLTLLMISAAALCAAEEEKVYKLPLDLTPGMPLVKENYLTDWHYKDPTIEMKSREERDGKILYWVAEVEIKDGTQIRTMPANSFEYSSHAQAGRLSRRANAVLACDGDFWWRDVQWKGNYVLRQGQMFMYSLTGNTDILLIDEDGDFHIIRRATEEDVPLPDENGEVRYNGKRVYNGLCFGPTLVLDGEAQVIEPDEHMITEKTPARIALCQMGELKYAIICCYARSMNLQEFAYLCESLGAKTAYNLDGGDSSMMLTGSRMLNRNNTTREIGDIVYFASAWPGEENPQ